MPTQNSSQPLTGRELTPVERAAYEFVESMVPRADSKLSGSPRWHGWALREAFEAGAKWQAAQGVGAAAQDVLAERQSQKDKGYDEAHDAQHSADELAYQAAFYLLPTKPSPHLWAHKSKAIDRDPRRKQIVKGIALGLAALERMEAQGCDCKVCRSTPLESHPPGPLHFPHIDKNGGE